MVLFNVVLWAFIFFTDDASIVEIGHKRDQLYQRSILYSKLLEPVFETKGLSQFSRKLAIREVFSDPILAGTDHIVVTRANDDEDKNVNYTYFDGQNREVTPLIIMTYLPDDADKKFVPKARWFDPVEAMFNLYKSFFDFEIVTEPYLPKRANFTRQFQILNSISD